jgi:hypothetical protein
LVKVKLTDNFQNMRIQHFIRTVLLISLLCGIGVDATQAHAARGGFSRGASASSFKSGFSSHNAGTANPTTLQPSAKNTSFGSFGASASAAQPTPASTASNSALSRNLSENAANSNALKTYDARNQAAALPTPAAGSSYASSGVPQRGYSNPPLYAQGAVPQTIVVQRDSGFSASPFLWFMLGRSMSNHDSERVVYEHPAYPATGAVNGPDTIRSPTAATPLEPRESIGAKLLRIVLWLLIAVALVMGVSYLLGRRAARAVTNKSHYSLGKN